MHFVATEGQKESFGNIMRPKRRPRATPRAQHLKGRAFNQDGNIQTFHINMLHHHNHIFLFFD
ncbi:MAG TPA: hypothetical protein DD383_02900 [Rikenellaceae bacterium]|nr:hypothetical protein [Rikenellaceae bacterium]